MKRLRKGQERGGSAERRALEFAVIVRQVKHRRAAFEERLKRNLQHHQPTGCMLHQGTLDHNAYPRMNFRHPGVAGHVTIHAVRVFAILMNRAPIPVGSDAAHDYECRNRRCVRHISIQPFTLNARSRGKNAGVPF